ncbi:MAG: EamA family transporter [Acinetobacter sp.]
MNSQLFATACMLLSMLSYQFSASFAKHLFSVVSPLTVTMFRLCFAAIMIILAFRSWKIIKKFKLLKWQDLLCYSAALGLMNFFFYTSLSHLPLGIAVGLEFIGPLGLALFSIQQRKDLIWVLFSVVGIVCLMPWGQQQSLSIIGMLFAVSAGLCWAAYIYFGHKVVRQNIGIHMLSVGISFSAFMLMPFELVFYADEFLNIALWPAGLMVALLATAVPYALDLVALKHLARLNYSILTSLSPVIAALTGFMVLSEKLAWSQWLALLMIMTASIGIAMSQHQRKNSQNLSE